MRQINRLILHCTATRPDFMAGATTDQRVAEIKRWHTAKPPNGNGWSDIGYHFLIDRDGSVRQGRPVEKIGAHVAGHNADSIGISLFGGHGSAATDRFEDNFTKAQDEALQALLAQLQGMWPKATIHGHNEYAAKACPGFTVKEYLETPTAWSA
jgi:N-acetylmuramoyl-L-alanine amidase